MRTACTIAITFLHLFVFGQKPGPAGIYQTEGSDKTRVVLNSDSTFTYTADNNPVFYQFEKFSENGRWTISGDSILLNPALSKKEFIESDFTAQEIPGDSILVLTFNHIKRYIDSEGHVFKKDTSQIMQLDFAFNEFRKKNRTRVTEHLNTCTFAGYLPKAIITKERTISIKRPANQLQSIFIGCYELQGVKKYTIENQNANRFTFNVYSNYYQDGLIRNVKFLLGKNGFHLNGKGVRMKKV